MHGGDFIYEKIRSLAYEPSKYVINYNDYNVNDFKFYTHEYRYYKIIMNGDVCIKDRWWEGLESDYYVLNFGKFTLSYKCVLIMCKTLNLQIIQFCKIPKKENNENLLLTLGIIRTIY